MSEFRDRSQGKVEVRPTGRGLPVRRTEIPGSFASIYQVKLVE
jgi:hypothetical protein